MKFQAHQAISILEHAGFEARIAGGAVRDYLLNKEPKDIDIATTARPVDVILAFEALGYSVIPTGLQHGTVTVVIDNEAFEITTLRIDKETDGRHAEVEFVEDWKLDAARRDFTFNAMFMDKDGKIYDFFDGESDLEKSIVRFVGNARDRIEEDYLRIMRYFRFLTRMKTVVHHDNTLNVIHSTAHGLDKISGERIWVELKKILDTPNPFTVIRLMRVLVGKQLGIPAGQAWMDYRDFNNHHHPLIKVIELYDRDYEVLMDVMKNRFKASSDEIEFVKTFFMLNDPKTTMYEVIKHAHKHVDNFHAVIAIMDTHKCVNSYRIQRFFTETGIFAVPEWPITGEDLIKEGFVPGKALGVELETRRKAWVDSLHLDRHDNIINL